VSARTLTVRVWWKMRSRPSVDRRGRPVAPSLPWGISNKVNHEIPTLYRHCTVSDSLMRGVAELTIRRYLKEGRFRCT
jgi:hypothetical protein